MTAIANTWITVEAIPGTPGFVADVIGTHADPETDPRGIGATREAAVLALARDLLEDTHPAVCLAIAAVVREEMARCLALPSADAHDRGAMRFAFDRAIAAVEGIA